MKLVKIGNYRMMVSPYELENENIIDLQTTTGDLIQISKNSEGQWVANNGMNGYGINIFREIAGITVEIIDIDWEKLDLAEAISVHDKSYFVKYEDEDGTTWSGIGFYSCDELISIEDLIFTNK